LVEDHPLFRDALVRGLRSVPFDVLFAVGSAANVPGGDITNLASVDVLILDVELPNESGLDVAQRVVGAGRGRPKVVILSSHDDAQTVREARRVGCAAFISKAVALEELVAVLNAVHRGETRFPPEHDRPEAVHVSARELDCLTLVAEGFTNRAVADALGISYETVKTTLGNVRAKLGAIDRAHAVARAYELGYLKRKPSSPE